MTIQGILIFFHCPSNTGYAIGRLEPIFFEMARRLTASDAKIHLSYTSLDNGDPSFVPSSFNNVICFDPTDDSTESLTAIQNYIQKNKIDVAFGFDQPVSLRAYQVMRKAGVRVLISYWGAPMSSINSGVKLLLKKIEVRLKKYKPDLFIFESKAMADTAVYGRGIHPRNVAIVNLGVDVSQFSPNNDALNYAHYHFGIPSNRQVVCYSGHMEDRKGVHIILAAANLLVGRNRRDAHFLFLGNRENEARKYENMFIGTPSQDFITFGGYRKDITSIFPSCHVGVIASTGWDSFTMSSLEMASSGLPLLVSRLDGLVEAVENEVTGLFFEPGNPSELADKLEYLLDNPDVRKKFAAAGRKRVTDNFSRQKQIINLASTIERFLTV